MERLINNLKSLEAYVLSKAEYPKSDKGVQLWENDLECIRAGIRALESLAELKDFAAKELETVADAAEGEENTYAGGVLKGTEHLKAYIDRAYTYAETGGKPCD